MQAFDIALYALAIITVLLLRAERPTTEAIATPAPAAPAPIVDEPQAEPAPQPEAPAQPAAIAAPVVVATVEVAELPTEFADMNSEQLRKECQTRGIRWRNAHSKGKHLSNKEMLAALA